MARTQLPASCLGPLHFLSSLNHPFPGPPLAVAGISAAGTRQIKGLRGGSMGPLPAVWHEQGQFTFWSPESLGHDDRYFLLGGEVSKNQGWKDAYFPGDAPLQS